MLYRIGCIKKSPTFFLTYIYTVSEFFNNLYSRHILLFGLIFGLTALLKPVLYVAITGSFRIRYPKKVLSHYENNSLSICDTA